jgi:hypothetical protein
MSNTAPNDINVANVAPSSVKPCFEVGKNFVIILDKNMAKKVGIKGNTLIQQELTQDGILLKIRRRDGQ